VAQAEYFPGINALGAERAQIVAVFDTMQQRVDDALAMNPGAAGYTTFGAFLAHDGGDGMDLVFNLTPAPLHRDITARALESGFHVYSEKPIAASVQEAVDLAAIADQQGRQLFVAPSTMVTARMRWITSMLDAGELGEPWFVKAAIAGMGPAAWSSYIGDPRVFYKKGVGPLIDTGVYMLHTITGLLGPATRVQATGGIVYPERPLLIERFAGESVTVETPDIVSLNLELENNRFAHLFSSFATPATKSPWFELYARQGTISITQREWYNGNGATDIYRRSEDGSGPADGWSNGVPVPKPSAAAGILESGILHAIECLETGAESVLTARHATHVLEIMTGALQSIETGEPVTITTRF
jgi:predicted dehydrogenase